MGSVRPTISYTSTWPTNREEELTRLMFFNLNQQQVAKGIVSSIDLYGLPELDREGDFLRFKVAKLPEVQTLFAVASVPDINKEMLAGVMIYARTDESKVVLIHFGVHEAFSSQGQYSHMLLAIQLMGKLRDLARKIRGVKTIELLYQRHGPVQLKV